MKPHAQLKADVTCELQWDPAVNDTHIGVAVKVGAVTLTGHLDTCAEKYAVERAVQRVEGVRGRVDPWAERAAAQGAAWSAPGINLVVNELKVGSAA